MNYTFLDPPLLSVEHSYDSEFMYFVKVDPEKTQWEQNEIEDDILHAPVKPNFIMTLLKQLDDVYNPKIYSDQSWPENVKKEFVGALHKFMATLTQASQQQEGYTKLYIPKEDLSDHV